MKHLLLLCAFLIVLTSCLTAQAQIQIPDYKTFSSLPGSNYNQIVSDVRAKLQLKKVQLVSMGINVEKNEAFREEVAIFERWAHEWHDKIAPDGRFPNPLTGWINAMQSNPELFNSQANLQNPNNVTSMPWTSIGPVDNGNLNGWSYGGGIGRVNVVRRHPQNLQILFAGTPDGGLFKSTNLGTSWSPTTDQFAGLGISDFVFLPTSPNQMIMATGDYDGKHINSIGVFKTIDGGNSWVNKLPFTLDERKQIAHLYVDPAFATNTTIWATSTFDIYRSVDQGETWNSVFNTGQSEGFNDFVKVGTNYFTSGTNGSLFKSVDGTTWNQVYTHPSGGRVDFSYSANTPDILYILTQSNPAFSKYTISTNTMGTFSVVNNNTADPDANYGSQQSYNQVIASNPLNGNDLMIGETNGKRSTDGGVSWNSILNGYYTPTGIKSWAGGYVHSDHHYIEYIGAAYDSLLIGNDGGVYIGPASITPFRFKECFNGLVCTQSYSLSIFDAEPNNIMLGNQDNDSRSRYFNGTTSTWYAGVAGDGVSTAIHRSNKDIRFITGTHGTLAYRTDGYVGGYQTTSIAKPNDGVFTAPLEMHLSNGNILYEGFNDIYKSIGITPSGDPNIPDNANWVSLNSGLGQKPGFIGLSSHPTDASKQRIVLIGDSTNVVRKSTDEITWSTITPPVGVLLNSIYWSRTSDTMIATAKSYNAGNKVFFSANAGTTWNNISDNMPNILMVKAIRYEGTDSVFIATELGVYFAKLNPAGGVLSPQGIGWTKLGTGLPNVKVTDMEISYAKKQLFISSFGRGVWMTNLNLNVLATSEILFAYNNYNASNYSLNWKIDVNDIMKTVLEKSTDARTFTSVGTFTDITKKIQLSYLVGKENRDVYYRLYYINSTGRGAYSQTIALRYGKGPLKINVYPNPTNQYVNVISAIKMNTVKIMSVGGLQLTYAQPLSNFYSFDMSLLPKGIYVVQVLDVDGKLSAEKIIRN